MRNLLILVAVLLSTTLIAQKQNLYKGKYAAQGYDVISYFQGSSVEGKKEFSSNYKGAVYLFSTVKNKSTFDNNPEDYAPQYGGWCAYAMGLDGSKVKIDPETFEVRDNKLYLFYNFGGTNTLITWEEDVENLQKKADEYWKDQMK